jgi:GNAT superfamily N-acetyltransferase
VARLVMPGRAPLWFVEFREASAEPPAVNLMAFEGFGQQPGALLDGAAVSNVAVGSADQLGAVRWWPASGEVDQLYVAPSMRRRGVGTALVLTAGALSIARGWPRCWSDGQRTELGEAFVQLPELRGRVQPLTHLIRPMTPPGEQ